MSQSLRFLADMNLSPMTVAALQQEGWDIVRVSALLPATASDAEILILLVAKIGWSSPRIWTFQPCWHWADTPSPA